MSLVLGSIFFHWHVLISTNLNTLQISGALSMSSFLLSITMSCELQQFWASLNALFFLLNSGLLPCSLESLSNQ